MKVRLSKEMAATWVYNWDPEYPYDLLYQDMYDCTHIDDDAAAEFAKATYKYAGVDFSDSHGQLLLGCKYGNASHPEIETLSDTSALHLAKMPGALELTSLAQLTDTGAKHLSKMRVADHGDDVVQPSPGLYIILEKLPESAAKILRDAGHSSVPCVEEDNF